MSKMLWLEVAKDALAQSCQGCFDLKSRMLWLKEIKDALTQSWGCFDSMLWLEVVENALTQSWWGCFDSKSKSNLMMLMLWLQVKVENALTWSPSLGCFDSKYMWNLRMLKLWLKVKVKLDDADALTQSKIEFDDALVQHKHLRHFLLTTMPMNLFLFRRKMLVL